MGVVLNRPVGDRGRRGRARAGATIADAEPVFIGGPVQPQALVVLAEFNDPAAAAWIVAADVGFVAADTDYGRRSSDASAAAASTPATRAGAPASSRPSSPRRPGSSSRRCRRSCSPTIPRRSGSDVLARKGGQFALIARMPDDPSLN